jgi:hypothetical protein
MIIVAWSVRGFFDRGVVVVEPGGASTSCLLGEGRSVLPSLLGAVGNPSVEYPAMVHCGGGGPLWAGPMMMTPEVVGDELKTPKANDFAKGEASVRQAFVISSDGGRR